MIDLGVVMYIKLKCEFGQSMDCLDKACIHAFSGQSMDCLHNPRIC